MRLDTKQALRPVLCLPNPNAMQSVRWERARLRGACAVPSESERYARGGRGWKQKMSLRTCLCLDNPCAIRETSGRVINKKHRSLFDEALHTFSLQNPRQI